MTTPLGKITDQPIEAYHASDAVSKSKLDEFRIRPSYYKRKHIDRAIESTDTKSLLIGHASHTLLLEGDVVYWGRYCVVPTDAPRKPTKAQREAKNPSQSSLDAMAWWNKWALDNEGKVELTAEQDELNDRLRANVFRHPIASALLAEAEREVTWRIDLDVCRIQCRTDGWIDGCGQALGEIIGGGSGQRIIVDFKTCATLTDDGRGSFQKGCQDHGYHRQAGLYRQVVPIVTERDVDRFLFVVAEKSEPFEVGVYELGVNEIRLGYEEVYRDLENLAKCIRHNRWPGIPMREIQTIEFPSWYHRKGWEHAQGMPLQVGGEG